MSDDMKASAMNFGHLRTFVAVADAGGVHRAADRLHLSQPAVSRQIQALEGDLGVPLFDRIGRRVQLTAEGEDLLWRSRRLLAEARSFAERADALKKGDGGILRVGATPQIIESSSGLRLNGTPRKRTSSAAEVDRDDGDDGCGRGRTRPGRTDVPAAQAGSRAAAPARRGPGDGLARAGG